MIRREYGRGSLRRQDLPDDPLAAFGRWFEEACAAGLPEPCAMTLATVDSGGAPRARVVLLRGHDARGFAFFTHRTSAKGRELAGDPRAALVFFWAELERQVRVEGRVTELSDQESDAYFATRPVGSQLGALASPQSQAIESRAVLEQALAEARARFEGKPVPRPPGWGGYLLVPEAIEFWQGRPNRLHDRFLYRKSGGAWEILRLAP